jgi:hypothetical protein
MANRRSLGDLLHRLTHRAPGVPGHQDHEPGHQGDALPGAHPSLPNRPFTGARPSLNNRLSNAGANRGEPRVLAGWQRRIAAFFDRRKQ